MLDIRLIREAPDRVKENCRLRGAEVDIDAILALDERRRELLGRVGELRHEIKALSKKFREGFSREQVREMGRELREQEAEVQAEANRVEAELNERLSWVPNLLDPRVPRGPDATDEVVRVVGERPDFDFEPKSHDELMEALGLLDIPRAVRAARTRFYVMKNEAVRMRWALCRMFLDLTADQGWELVAPPLLAKDRTLFASGYLPFNRKDNFRIEGEDLSLIGTSEQAILGMHVDELLDRLPLLYLGDSMCFRTEAGSYGRDTKGILRVHQFYKLEQLVYCHPDEGERWHQVCLANEENLMRELGVPFRTVITTATDLGAPGALKYDTEAWLPSQRTWRETTSNTNLRDYQTRRGRIRYKEGRGKPIYPFTISATGFSDRLIIAIVENYQQADGSVVIPEALRPYLGGLDVIRPNR